jgi:hypothetical protein
MEVSAGASLLRRLFLRPAIAPGDAEAWSAALSGIDAKLLTACFLLQDRTNLDSGLVDSRVQATADLIEATQDYLTLAEVLAPKVSHDRHAAVLLGQTKRRAESIGTYFQRYVERSGTEEPAAFLAQMKGWLETVAYLDYAAHGYIDRFLASAPRRLFSRAGGGRAFRHGSYIDNWVSRKATETVVMGFEEGRIRFVLQLPGATSASLVFGCDDHSMERLARLLGSPRTYRLKDTQL